jgi:ubiquinone/menaquinone biosynthesis C-methylase UbiE
VNADERAVKEANRTLYDAIAEKYEAIDGRRSPELEAWLRNNLAELRDRAGGEALLDVGAGSGLVTRCARGLFARRVAVDISPRILAANKGSFDQGIAADLDHLPFRAASFSVVTSFAVLHHLYAWDAFVREVARILRPGGVFYSDHDMDRAFHDRFAPLLKVYRGLKDSKHKYVSAAPGINDTTYELAEFSEDGIDTRRIVEVFRASGLEVTTRFHWYGLTAITDRIFGKRPLGRGWAPLVSVLARKPRGLDSRAQGARLAGILQPPSIP